MSEGDSYYLSGGHRVPLKASPNVVIDLESEAVENLAESDLQNLRDKGRSLSTSLLLVPDEVAAEVLGETMVSAPGVHPVFSSEDGSLIVVLPEVRVEADAPESLVAAGRADDAHIKDSNEVRLILEPDSGRGADALRLANELAEVPGTNVAQARFLRIVARPGP